jgi:hypothetical protein
MFTFVNTIWLVSLVGMTFTFLPCLCALFKIVEPLIILLFQTMKTIVEYIFKEIVLPLVTFMHEWGIFEILLYLGSS